MNNYIEVFYPRFSCVTIDEQDIELYYSRTWYIDKHNRHLISTSGWSHAPLKFHREALNAQSGQIVDHINRNSLDNRRSNLRFVTTSQSALNRKMPDRVKKVKAPQGIQYRSDNDKWRAVINVDYRRINIGQFKTMEEAIEARKNYIETKLPHLKDFIPV